jgi:hypothetical protein
MKCVYRGCASEILGGGQCFHHIVCHYHTDIYSLRGTGSYKRVNGFTRPISDFA